MLFTDLCKVFHYLPHDHAKLQAYGCNLVTEIAETLIYARDTNVLIR